MGVGDAFVKRRPLTLEAHGVDERHAARVKDGPAICLADGVTGFIDAGSQGADRIDDVVTITRTAPQPARVLINIGRAGIVPNGDTMDLSGADVGAARAAIEKHRDVIVGVKARLSREVAGANDYEVLRRAQDIVGPLNLSVMIHMGQTTSPLDRLFGLLKAGDIVTHMFAPPPNGIVDDRGRILPERFTRVDAATIDYELKVTDPVTFTQPRTAISTLRATAGPLYEYGCHEGNYSMPAILKGARVEEKDR